MACDKCWLEDPKQSKFCRHCGEVLGIRLRCPECGSENPGDSLFCIVCGARLSGNQKSIKGSQRKCRNCGHFNELDARYCVGCGEEITRLHQENRKEPTVGPSYKTIGLVIGLVFLTGLSVKFGLNIFKSGAPPRPTPIAASIQGSSNNVDESQVLAVAKNFKCACGGCGELPLATCECEMPKGSVEEKRFIREKLADGYTVEQVIELLDKKYGHKV